MSDESQLQVRPKGGDSSLVLSSARSNLVARGRRDAAILAVRCNKCGQRKELAFAGCVCASCSDDFDRQWADSTLTDWVLVAFWGPEPPEFKGFTSRFSFFACMWEAFVEKRISREELEAAVVGANSTDNSWWPFVYVYTKTTYAQMKSHWAKCDPPDSLCIGPMTVDEFVENGVEGVYVYPNPWPHGRKTARGVPWVRPAIGKWHGITGSSHG